jgi:hypothetical protein
LTLAAVIAARAQRDDVESYHEPVAPKFSTATIDRVKLSQNRLWIAILPPLSESDESSMASISQEAFAG